MFLQKQSPSSFIREFSDEIIPEMPRRSIAIHELHNEILGSSIEWLAGTPNDIIHATSRAGFVSVKPKDIAETLQQGFRGDKLSLSGDVSKDSGVENMWFYLSVKQFN